MATLLQQTLPPSTLQDRNWPPEVRNWNANSETLHNYRKINEITIDIQIRILDPKNFTFNQFTALAKPASIKFMLHAILKHKMKTFDLKRYKKLGITNYLC